MLQRHTSATLNRFESQLNSRHFSRMPISPVPLQYDLFLRLPADYTSHFRRALHDAAMDSCFKLHPEL